MINFDCKNCKCYVFNRDNHTCSHFYLIPIDNCNGLKYDPVNKNI